jgi:hypothetical protein
MKHPTVVEKNTNVVRNRRVVCEHDYITGLIVPGMNVEAVEAGVMVILPEDVQAVLPPHVWTRVFRQHNTVVELVEVSDDVGAVGGIFVVLPTLEVFPDQGHQ